MELGALKRDMDAIENGRWVDHSEVPELEDIRLKLRGGSCDAAREKFASLERAAPAKDRGSNGLLKPLGHTKLLMQMIKEWYLVDIEGLTDKGVVLTVDQVRAIITTPALRPLADLIILAVQCVDGTREKAIEEAVGNSSA